MAHVGNIFKAKLVRTVSPITCADHVPGIPSSLLVPLGIQGNAWLEKGLWICPNQPVWQSYLLMPHSRRLATEVTGLSKPRGTFGEESHATAAQRLDIFPTHWLTLARPISSRALELWASLPLCCSWHCLLGESGHPCPISASPEVLWE